MGVKSANVMARVEPNIKAKAEAIMAYLGLPASVVINALYHQVIYTKSIPFSMSLPEKIPSLESMSKEEFDSVMEASLADAKQGKAIPLDEAVESVRKEIKL